MGVCCVYAWSGERRESPCVKRHTNVVVRCVRVVCGCVVWLRVGACVDGRAGSPTPWSAVGVGEEVIAIAGSCFCALPLRAGSAVCEPFFCGSADCSFDQLRTSRGKRRSTASVGGFVAILSVDAVCLERKVVVESACLCTKSANILELEQMREFLGGRANPYYPPMLRPHSRRATAQPIGPSAISAIPIRIRARVVSWSGLG